MRLSELIDELGAQVFKPAIPGSQNGKDFVDFEVTGVAPIDKAQPGQITFLTNPEYVKFASQCRAGAVIVAAPVESCPVLQIIHPNPYYAFAKTSQHFYKLKRSFKGISPLAYIDPSAKIGEGVTIYPFATVLANADVGARTTLFSGVFLGEDS